MLKFVLKYTEQAFIFGKKQDQVHMYHTKICEENFGCLYRKGLTTEFCWRTMIRYFHL